MLKQDKLQQKKLILTAKLLKQGYIYHKYRKAFSKFYHRYSKLIVKYKIGLILLQQGISEPIFMVIRFINSKELFETLVLVINSKR